MKISIMTLFPEMCETVMSESIIGRARRAEKVEINCVNIRDFSGNKHNKVDDTPYGGGMGMVMSAQPIYNCFSSLYNAECEEKPHLIYLSPKGKTFNQQKAIELSKLGHIVLLCGHYEGVDQRVIDEIGYRGDKLTIIDCPDIIDCNESPTMAIRRKVNSSLVAGLKILKEQEDVIEQKNVKNQKRLIDVVSEEEK